MKLTPLTTRPAVTSRQGMIRLVSIAFPFTGLNGLRQIDSAGIQSLANDGSLDVQFRDCLQVVDGADAARCDQRAAWRHVCNGCLHCLQGRQIWPAQCAITSDVGVYKALHA